MCKTDREKQTLHYQAKLQYEIDAWDLYQLFAAGENIVVIDARSLEAYKKEYIPGAINFPYRDINKESAAQLLNFETQYVTYCDGIGCNASTKSALKLVQLGYKVKELIGGIDWWKRDLYPTSNQTINNQLCDSKQTINNCGCED